MSKPQAPDSKRYQCLLDTAAVSTQDVFDSAATDLAISLTIHKSFFVEFDCSLIAPLTRVVFSDLGADLCSKLLLHGDGVRLLQLHPLQHLGLHVSGLYAAGTQSHFEYNNNSKHLPFICRRNMFENIDIHYILYTFLLLSFCPFRHSSTF